jgi:hypothetical protein
MLLPVTLLLVAALLPATAAPLRVDTAAGPVVGGG